MPGLKQLEAFNKDVQNLGNEIEIRKTRGEKPAFIPIPEGVSEDDDSQDFVLGLPQEGQEAGDLIDVDDPDAAPDFASFAASLEPDALEPLESAEGDEPELEALTPDLDSILSPSADDIADLPDLSDFETDVVLPPEPEKEIPLEDQGLDALLKPSTLAENPDELPDVPDDATELSALAGMQGTPDYADIQGGASSEADLTDIPDLQTTLESIGALDEQTEAPLDEGASFAEAAAEPAEEPAPAEVAETDAAPFDAEADALPDMAALDEPASEEPLEAPAEMPALDAPAAESDLAFDLPDPDALELPEAEAPAETEVPAVSEEPSPIEAPETSEPESAPEAASEPASPDSFDLDSLGSLDGPELSLDALSGDNAGSSLDIDALMADLDGAGSAPAPASDENEHVEELPSLDASDSPAQDEPLSFDEQPAMESFDTSEIDGLDFSAPAEEDAATAAAKKDIFASLAEEFSVTGEDSGDFELDTNFEIPGFSDTDSATFTKKKVDTPDFSKAEKDKPRNSLTEEEFEQFKKNLANYPLNLRIAIEDLIAKNEYTDEAVFDVIEKVLKKTTARSLAGYLEKMLDISIDVPRDFERRSVAQYEAYKQSFQYQLKNRILPAAIVGVILCVVGYGLFRAGHQFIYKPAKAASLYKQGYTLLENNEYPQSELVFAQAVSYKPVKKWFFTYAHGYREHKQYERAAKMYGNILQRFKHDKLAGLEYAEMELYDRANYPRAEEVVRREVLDYHINDADGMLLLGDIFLEWADIAPEKYEDARTQYATLIQLYGGTSLYLSRMMRYFIRTDHLNNVLELKNTFYASKDKGGLSAADWTELSGYLLDKLYGPLSKSEEYLRSSIEDVLDMLNNALKLDPKNPVAHYNLARYYIENSTFAPAVRQLETALDLFADAPVRTRRNAYKEIDTARTLGELYTKDKEYIKAQTAYTRGINVYNDEHARAGLEGDANTGKLFADMGDLDYFVSGDADSALYNYQKATGMYNDTPSLNYRIGAIYYGKKQYDEALGSFIKTAEMQPSDANLLLALANTLALRGDNYAAQGYYSDLISRLNQARREILRPQQDEDDNKIVDLYLKATNNLGVTLYYLARQTGNSSLNAESMVRLSDSMRAWDALTRNPKTMRRLAGSNLAAQNSKYITHPYPDYEPAIYTDIARVLSSDLEME